MLVEAIRLVLVVALLVVLPGWLLVNAAFPSRLARVRGVERAYFALVGGALLLILAGVTLGFLPHDGTGYFRTLVTGAPNVELAMAALCVVLLYVGVQRGAYPKLTARFPRLAAPEGRRRVAR